MGIPQACRVSSVGTAREDEASFVKDKAEHSELATDWLVFSSEDRCKAKVFRQSADR